MKRTTTLFGRILFAATLCAMLSSVGQSATPVSAPDCGCQIGTTPEVNPESAVLEDDSAVIQAAALIPATCGVEASCGCNTCDTCCSEPTCGAAACCKPCCLTCCDRCTVYADAIFLRRSDAGPLPLITSQNTGDTLVDVADLDFNHEVLPRIGLIREYCNCWGWGISFFGTDAWDSSETGGENDSPVLQGPGVDFPSTAPGTVFGADYGSSLYNGELNLRRRCHECVTFLAGFRWAEFGDTLRTYSVAPVVQDFYTLDATNHMYGPQIGVDATLIQTNSRFRIDAIARAGIMANHIDYTASSAVLGIGGTDNYLRDEEDETAFVGDFGLRGVFQLTNHLAVFGGYQVLWFDGVALAADQLGSTNLISPGSVNIDQSTAFFHGASVGLQASF